MASAVERLARTGTHLLLRTPLRAATLAALRAGVRARPEARPFTAPAFYAGEVLAATGGRLDGRLLTGARIQLLAADEVHRHIYFYGEYERPTTRLLRSIATPGWTFLDVGANAGYYSLLAADLGGPSSQVHAFEPNPAMLELLETSAATVPAVHVVPAACGDHPDRAELSLSADAANSGLASLRAERSATTVTVAVVTLDEYCTEHGVRPDVIKIDVEGYEPEVLAGAARLLGERVPGHLVSELVPQRWEPGPVFDAMAGYGYAVSSLGPDGTLRPYEERDYQNIVFVRKE